MKHFKLLPSNIIQIKDQSLWLNKHITIDNKIILWKQWQQKGLNIINDLLDKENNFLSPNDIKTKFNIKCTHLDINQIKTSIPKLWKVKIRHTHINLTTNNTLTLKIEINNKYQDIQKTSCKDFYWHLINKTKHEPKSRVKLVKYIYKLNKSRRDCMGKYLHHAIQNK